MRHKKRHPVAATHIPLPPQKTVYPPPFDKQVAGREKRKLGDFFGLSNFGVNHTTLKPGAVSALAHYHEKQDEFIYVLQGQPTLILDHAEYTLKPGDCYGFKAGEKIAAQVVNTTEDDAVILEIGDRTPGDSVVYPDDDLQAIQQADGSWQFLHKDGTPC